MMAGGPAAPIDTTKGNVSMNHPLFCIPRPKSMVPGTGAVTPAPTVGGDFPAIAAAFSDYVRRLGGAPLAPAADPAVCFRADPALAGEAYTLAAADGRVLVRAATAAGARNGMATLLQLLTVGQDGAWTVPAVTVEDAPDCAYRAVMVDLARDFHPFAYLLSYVDLCALYKIPYLHLHFTDAESYTLPSRLYPALSTPGRHYTDAEIAALGRYAADRAVEIIPEIDVPGHCDAFCTAYGDLFGRDGIITRTAEATAAMQALFSELCDMFPASGRIHIGGDEAAILKWTTDPACRAYAIAQGIDFDGPDKRYIAERLLSDFVQKMADAVLAKGRIPMAWEGFSADVNEFVSRKIQIVSWENYYQTTDSLLAAGFTVVNASWKPMYIVTPRTYWTQEEVFDWDIFHWQAVHSGSPYYGKTLAAEPTPAVIGGQLLAWGDHIAGGDFPTVAEGIAAERALIAERAPMLAENTWNREKRRTYADAAAAYAHSAPLFRAFAGD